MSRQESVELVRVGQGKDVAYREFGTVELKGVSGVMLPHAASRPG